MMTDAEIQLVLYLEALLRQRGYPDVARMLTAVTGRELERRDQLMTPARQEWPATG